MPIWYGYQDVLFGTQTTVNGSPVDYNFAPPSGGAWTYTGSATNFAVRENVGATTFNGDPTNEMVSAQEQIGGTWEQVVNIGGTFRQVIWDYTFEITSPGGTVYRVGVIDVDLNNDNDLQDAGEDGYFLVFLDGLPPPGVNYTVGAIVKNDNGTPHVDMGAAVVCFGEGTRIATPQGPRAIETLAIGDLINTMDNGPQPLRWVGRRSLAALGKVAPIVIRKGHLGNTADLVVSPLHRMLVSGWQAELMFGQDEVLVAARDLVDGVNVLRRAGGMITYFHLLFDRHEIVLAEGCHSESLMLAATGMSLMPEEHREEIRQIFPELRGRKGKHLHTARPCLKRHEAQCLTRAA
jgi:hypothetical protein